MSISVYKKWKRLVKTYRKLRLLPAHVLIEKPDDYIFFSNISSYLKTVLGLEKASIYFSRRTLKHISEKPEYPEEILYHITSVINQPREIRKAKNKSISKIRYLVVGSIPSQEKPFVVVLEAGKPRHFIVTAYTCSDRYLSNFDLLWRAAQPPSAYSPKK